MSNNRKTAMPPALAAESSLNKQKNDDLERYMQLRDEIQESIKKIDPSVAQLQGAISRFVSQFDVFQKLSQDTQEQLKRVLKETSQDIAQTATKQLSQRIDEMIKDKIYLLDESILNASKVLNESTKSKYRKLLFVSCIGIFLSGLAGFSYGQIYSKKNTFTLPPQFMRAYLTGNDFNEALKKMTSQEKKQLNKLFPNMQLPK